MQPFSEKNTGQSKPSSVPDAVDQPGFSRKIKQNDSKKNKNKARAWDTGNGKKKPDANQQYSHSLTNEKCHNSHFWLPKGGYSHKPARNHQAPENQEFTIAPQEEIASNGIGVNAPSNPLFSTCRRRGSLPFAPSGQILGAMGAKPDKFQWTERLKSWTI